jgi:ABC-2 type transport system ATP-binding protein
MTPLLEVNGLRKRYGDFDALADVTFHVESGELFGLLGPNGAGKTTLLSILACLLDADAGNATIAGSALRKKNLVIRRDIGIGTQELSLYAELSARENLRFFGKLYGLRGGTLNTRVDEVLELAGLQDRANDRVGTYSGGMKRRLNLAVAVIHRPRLLLLDEPTTGVDPQSRNHIFQRVRQLNKEGITIIYTSHYMEEVQELCTRIGILDRGKMIACDTLTGLLHLLKGAVRMQVAQDVEKVREAVSRLPQVHVTSVEGNTLVLSTVDVSKTILQVVSLLRQLDVELTGLETHEPNLERVFLHLTERTLRD